MASDEILFKVALDLSKADSQFKDHSELWEKHTQDIAKGEKAMNDYANNTVKDYEKINKAVKSKIGQVAAEGKAIQELDKKFQTLSKKNKDAFDSEELKKFDELVRTLSKDMGAIENLNLSVDDIDLLTSKLENTKDDFESLNVLVDFFETKMIQASVGVVGSLEAINEKIIETQLNIKSTEDFIKDSDKKISKTAPGQVQANLISEREAATKALQEEKIALEDYKLQLKEVRTENVSMSTQLRKVKDEMVKLELEGKRGGDRWVELSELGKDYNTVLKETNAELNRASKSTAGLDNLIGAVNGIVGVYAAAEGAQALFGSSSEDLQKTLVKLNGAIALLNGLQAIQTELAKKETITGKALNFVKKQYTIATNTQTKSTLRLAAATKLLGIGLIIGALVAVVTHWKDIAKWIGITSDESERSNEINKVANETYGEQIAKLTLLVKSYDKETLSIEEKEKAVKDYNKEFGDTLGIMKSVQEFENKIIANVDKYISYLQLKAKAEAAYQLAIENTKKALEERTTVETGFFDSGRIKKTETGSLYNPFNYSFVDADETAKKRAERNAKEFNDLTAKYFDSFKDFNKSAKELAKELNIDIENLTEDGKKSVSSYLKLLEDLVNKQKKLKTNLIDNDREREKTVLTQQLEDEKQAYKKQIDELKISEKAKAKLRDEFNKLYNEKTGLSYEQLRKQILEIDKKYNEELEKVQFKALNAIDSILTNGENIEREAIKDKWDNIRDEIETQIEKTNDKFKKEGLENILLEIDGAEDKELEVFDRNVALDKVDREKDIADAILRIYQSNNNKLIQNEELKQLQLLALEKEYLSKLLQTYKDSFKNIDDKSLFEELTNTLKTSIDPEDLQEAGEKLRDAFGDEIADEILNTVAALKEVGNEIDNIGSNSNFQNVVDDIGDWTSSLESFSQKLADALGLQGESATEFAEGIAFAIESTWNSLQDIFQEEIDQHQDKIDSFQESIDDIENELEREKELYEQGYANNFEARQNDLENLKEQKAKEEEALKKAQNRKAVLAKAEFLIDTASQLSNMVTAATKIFAAHASIQFAGVAISTALVAAMFGAFAVAKITAFQAIGSGQSFRQGLKEGRLSLDGPSHEQGGFGLYNSKTGDRVAEFEDGEKVYVTNKQQHRKYSDVLDAMIIAEKGGMSLDHYLSKKYAVSKLGKDTLQVVKNVNQITIKANESKEKASKHDETLVKEIRDFKDIFEKEFDGYKKERNGNIKTWETPKHFFVRQGNTTKKYAKE